MQSAECSERIPKPKAINSKIQPAADAVPVTDDARAQQGIPRRGQVEQTARLQERAVGGADSLSYSNGTRTAVETLQQRADALHDTDLDLDADESAVLSFLQQRLAA